MNVEASAAPPGGADKELLPPPIAVLVWFAAFVVLLLTELKLVPVVVDILEQSGVELPMASLLALRVDRVLRHWWFVSMLGVVGCQVASLWVPQPGMRLLLRVGPLLVPLAVLVATGLGLLLAG